MSSTKIISGGQFLLAMTLGVTLGTAFLWLLAFRHKAELLSQAEYLTELSGQAERDGWTAKTLVQRLQEAKLKVGAFDPNEPDVIVTPAETNVLGLGGRWIVNMDLDNEGRILQARLELQPVGWP